MNLRREVALVISNWIASSADVKDMVIESSVSLSRNFNNYLFVDKMNTEDARNLVDTILCILCSKDIDEEFTIIKLWECSDYRLKALLDRNIITEKLLKRKDKSAVIINKRKTLSININEEDHIRIQCNVKELSLMDIYEYANKIDNYIEEDMTYSFSEELGYLTSSISNVGTGLKATVILHLPAISLSEEIPSVTKELNSAGMNVESFYREGAKDKGNIYAISNEVTLGIGEEEIIKSLEKIVSYVSDEENKFRDAFSKKYKYELEDRVFRAYGILKNAKLLREKEMFDLLSYVRLGSEISLLNLNKSELDMLLIETRDSVIQNNYERKLNDTELNLVRASIVKQVL